MTLSNLLKASTPDPAAIAAHLNGLSSEQQVAEVRALSIKNVHRCWAMAEPGESIDLDYLVPDETPQGVAVRHLGINTLPVSRFFEKRFARAADQEGELWGYNHQPLAWLTGPGSFVVHAAGSDGEQALFIDYRSYPSGDIEGWPAARSNDSGIAKLVYGGMQDFMRKVSDQVSVGRAFVAGKDRKASFMLVRV
jgi:hypothetical protein